MGKPRLPRKMKKRLKYDFECGFFNYDPDFGFNTFTDPVFCMRALEDQEEFEDLCRRM